jgi:alkyldihydroxyacetonephosphate synthase
VTTGISPAGAIVVDLSSLDEVSDVDEKSRLVRAQAGVGGSQLHAVLSAQGFRLGHEPQSLALSTVGGWIATRACGQLSAAYGGIEDLVAGMVAVLPGGRVVESKTIPRRSAGPDIAALMIGSEGALGIVTEATLRVVPVPTARADRSIRFKSMADGVAACRRVAQSGIRPSVVRLYDNDDAALLLRHFPDEEVSPVLLLSVEGDGDEPQARADAAAELCGGSAGNSALVAWWWDHRNDAVDEFRRLMSGEGLLGPHGLVDTMEVAGTWTDLRALYHAMKDALVDVADVAACHLSHVYADGACLYFTLGSACPDEGAAAALHARWWEVGMRTCLDNRGSISHHHGIGRLKAPWLAEELGGWWEILAAVKRAVDPKGIMNPGVLGL